MIAVLLITFLFGLSCKDGKRDPPVKKDSVIIVGYLSDASVSSLDSRLPGKLFSKDFIGLYRQFNKDSSGRMDSTREIPLQLIKQFMDADFDTSFNRSANPRLRVANRYGYFFVIKVNCITGGDCASYHLLSFDKDGKFISTARLGLMTAEEDNRFDFTYKLTSDTTLITDEIEKDLKKDRETKSPEKVTRPAEISILVKLSP
jgi:hypothetical protein